MLLVIGSVAINCVYIVMPFIDSLYRLIFRKRIEQQKITAARQEKEKKEEAEKAKDSEILKVEEISKKLAEAHPESIMTKGLFSRIKDENSTFPEGMSPRSPLIDDPFNKNLIKKVSLFSKPPLNPLV